MDELEKQVKEVVDEIYYQGVDAGGVEYGTEYWTSKDDTKKILDLFQTVLEERVKQVQQSTAQEIIEEIENKMADEKIWLQVLSYRTVVDTVYYRSQGWDVALLRVMKILENMKQKYLAEEGKDNV